MAANPIPEGYHTLTPVVVADDADGLLIFLQRAFGAQEVHVVRSPDGRILHADITIGDSHMMFAHATPDFPATTAAVHLYVPETQLTYAAALAAGATSIREPAKQFYGDITAAVRAHQTTWSIGSRVEEVAGDELERRTKEALRKQAGTA